MAHSAPSLEELAEAITAAAENEDDPTTLMYEPEVYAAYGWNLSLEADDIADWVDEAEEAYSGSFRSDEDFAEETAESLGAIDRDASWPLNHIDWTSAASDLMMDYFECGGHYFRNM